jgi:hypothetical protein
MADQIERLFHAPSLVHAFPHQSDNAHLPVARERSRSSHIDQPIAISLYVANHRRTLPMNPAQQVDKVKKAYEGLTGISMISLQDSGFWVDRARMTELILFVDVLRIMSRAVNLQPSQLRQDLRDAIGDALQQLAAGSVQARALLRDPMP